MNSGSAASLDIELYHNWFPTGVWQGRFSGYYGGGLGNQGVEGYYWSSTAGDTDSTYHLNFGDGYIIPGGSLINKDTGYAVRCAI